jgi:hypothetical protein
MMIDGVSPVGATGSTLDARQQDRQDCLLRLVWLRAR